MTISTPSRWSFMKRVRRLKMEETRADAPGEQDVAMRVEGDAMVDF